MSIAKKICSVEGCERPTKGLGLCAKHYGAERLKRITTLCLIEGCEKTVYSHNWCTTHYWRWWRSGNPEYIKYPLHGFSKTTESIIWTDIKMRCYNKSDPAYKNYGGRGIEMFEPWVDSFLTFREYLEATIGLRPNKKFTLDRIDNNKNYEPGNLRWATQYEQSNNKRNNILLTVGNRTQTISQWCKELNLSYTMVKSRLRSGLSDSKALGINYNPIRLLAIGDRSETIAEWARISGLNAVTITRRANAGWPEDKLLDPVVPQDRFITIDGVTRQLYEWVIISGLARGTISRRIRAGWPENRLLEPPRSKQ